MIHFEEYAERVASLMKSYDWTPVYKLANELREVWREGRTVFACGNGGSASSAEHFVNDLIWGVSPENGNGIRAQALTANSSIMTCLANETCYAGIFAYQLAVSAKKGDMLVVFSGSGNSSNIVAAVEKSKHLGMRTAGILGYSGGKVKEMMDFPVHFPIDDMQISEDCQMIAVHMLSKWLKKHPVERCAAKPEGMYESRSISRKKLSHSSKPFHHVGHKP